MEGGASVEYDGGGGLAGLDTDWIWQEDVVSPHVAPAAPSSTTGPTNTTVCCSPFFSYGGDGGVTGLTGGGDGGGCMFTDRCGTHDALNTRADFDRRCRADAVGSVPRGLPTHHHVSRGASVT